MSVADPPVTLSQDSSPYTIDLNKRKVELKKMHIPGTRSISNGVKLELEHVFGLPNHHVNPYMFFYTEDKKADGFAEWLILPTGRKFVGYSTKDLKAMFLKADIEITSIAAMGFTSVKGIEAFALAETQLGKTQAPRVIVYVPKKEKKYVLSHEHLLGGTSAGDIEILQIAFSGTPSKYCITLARVGKGSIHASYFRWKKTTLTVSQALSPKVTRVAFNPMDETEFVACGNKYLRYYEISEGKMKEGTEIKRSEERKNNYIGVEFFPGSAIFLAICDRRIGYQVEDHTIRSKFALDYKTNLKVPLEDQQLRGDEEKEDKVAEVEEDKEIAGNSSVAGTIDPDWRKQTPVPCCFALANKRFAIGWRNSAIIGLYEINRKDIDNIVIVLSKLFNMGEDYYDVMSLLFDKTEENIAIALRSPLKKQSTGIIDQQVWSCFQGNYGLSRFY